MLLQTLTKSIHVAFLIVATNNILEEGGCLLPNNILIFLQQDFMLVKTSTTFLLLQNNLTQGAYANCNINLYINTQVPIFNNLTFIMSNFIIINLIKTK